MSIVALETAKMNSNSADEAHLAWGGFNLQQSIEMLLKHVLEQCGVRYREVHHIGQLLAHFPDLQDYIPENILDELHVCASELTEWEQLTRYNKNYLVSKKYLDRYIDFAMMLIQCVLDAEKRIASADRKRVSRLELTGGQNES